MNKGTVTVNLGEIQDCTLDELERQIADARKREQAEGLYNLRIELETDSGYYGDSSASCHIYGTRDETDEEYAIRLGEPTRRREAEEAWERREYERLRLKYEGK